MKKFLKLVGVLGLLSVMSQTVTLLPEDNHIDSEVERCAQVELDAYIDPNSCFWWKRQGSKEWAEPRCSLFVELKSVLSQVRDAFENKFYSNSPKDILSRYLYLKELLKRSFKTGNFNWSDKQKINLLYTIQVLSEPNQEKLFAYNLLRAFMQLPLAHSVADIHRDWLRQEEYTIFKQKIQESYLDYGYGPAGQLTDLAFKVLYHTSCSTAETLYKYNFLRELLHKDPVKNIADVDRAWLKNIMKEYENAAYIENRLRSGIIEEATPAQERLVKEAQEFINLDKNIKAYGSPEELNAEAGPGYISVCKSPDLDYTLVIIYHELGHFVYDDYEIFKDQEDGLNISQVEEWLKSPVVQESAVRANEYLQKGIATVDQSTQVGRHILELIGHDKDRVVFWIPPSDREKYLESLLRMSAERRADLFMLDKLYEQNKISAILHAIDSYGSAQQLVAPEREGFTSHPSEIERALYMIGFLASKNIDVNAELKKWETSGTCVSREDMFAHENPV